MPALTIGFAHPAFRFAEEFAARGTGHDCFQAGTLAELQARIASVNILVTARIWTDALLDLAPKLRFIQASSSGTEQFDTARIGRHGVRLASAQGINVHAVSEHAMGLLLTLTRNLNLAHRNQARHSWQMRALPIDAREQELHGKTMLIIGLGAIGARLATLAKAFGMRVIGVRRQIDAPMPDVDLVIPPERLDTLLPQADVLALTCPLTEETRGMINAERLALLPRTAYLINTSRGLVVNESALITALADGQIAGAGLDCFAAEPLSHESPLWDMENVVITPHTAGNMRLYERRVVDLLIENMHRLESGEMPLRNQVI
ncbi:D-2-hydroxyacid dehydrogenase [Paralcaligenes sp. KSB-10]|uniref:D-2-hydroxyacid dehydrogenase n=1 Tax=Paralcaligenes sp. KSB-10 TaxID=2901142 RepID=UPI001E3338D6|nr:D-2-hydroxyacid dehydrogenase [Paralcaligenes sp. KSB-10]UHL63541.1 D-2-hydroxyacid dehydrogenase [Paralcaligenes sp. KSB-10]